MAKAYQGKIYKDGSFRSLETDGRNIAVDSLCDFVVIPGLVDVHVHLREPGFCYKEDIATGTEAAARGGYAAVCSMPNLNPVPDCLESLSVQLDAIKSKAKIRVYPYGSITVGEKGKELSRMAEMAPFVCGFSDDGRGVQDSGLMFEAMQEAKSLNKLIVAHCEDDRLIGGCVNNCEYALKRGLTPLSGEAEWRQLGRDMELVAKVGGSYHACHLSAKESVEIIRQAKKSGLDVTCETAPHYLSLTDEMLADEGRFKMNPPLRSFADREALIEGVSDGTVDMIATDHAPHSAEEKAKGLEKSAFGIVGLETAFAVMYTDLVLAGKISMERLVEIMSVNPARRFKIEITDGDHAVFDISTKYKINSAEFASRGKSTPFEGKEVRGKCIKTVVNGGIVWQK